MLKYLLKPSKTKIDDKFLKDVTNETLDDKNENEKLDENDYIEESSIADMFSQKGSIFLMISLFLLFIAIIIYISFRRFF